MAATPSALKQYAHEISQIEYYLAGIRNITASFTQTSEEGEVSRGKFYLQRPGKMRWEYAPPTPILMVANAGTLTFFDAELDQVHFISLDDTIAGFLASTSLKLNSNDIALINFQKHQGHLYATVQQRNTPENGQLTLVFAQTPNILLRQVIFDGEFEKTTVTFENLTAVPNLPANLFVFKDPRGVINRHKNR